MTNPTIKEIVAQYLKANGYDGLYNEAGECGCELSDLFACGGNDCDCHAGYKVPCDPNDCPNHGDCAWHIAAERQTQGTRTEDLAPGEDWAAKHCDPEPATDTSERDFRRALVVALAPTMRQPQPWAFTAPDVCDCADEIATEYLLRELRRERGGE